jgi:hypothetical protein
MRGISGMVALALCALLMDGCATRSDAVRDNKDSPYENTDRPIVPYENTNRPIMALDFGGDEYAAVRVFIASIGTEIHGPATGTRQIQI